jgi:hypothetical protein
MSAFPPKLTVVGAAGLGALIAKLRERQDKLAKDRRCKSTAE